MRKLELAVAGAALLFLFGCGQGTSNVALTAEGQQVTAAAFTSSVSASPPVVEVGGTTTITAQVTSDRSVKARVTIDVLDAAGATVFSAPQGSTRLKAGNTRTYLVDWAVPASQAGGLYDVQVSVFDTSGTLLSRALASAVITVQGPAASTPTDGGSTTTTSPTPTDGGSTTTNSPPPTDGGTTTTTPSSPATLAVPVYEDALAPGFANWSWSSAVDFSSTGAVWSGTQAIAFTPQAAWAGLYLHTDQAVDTSSLAALHFAARASASGQAFSVVLYDANLNPLGSPVSLADFGGQPPAGSWRVYDLPLAALGASASQVTGVVIQDATGAAQPTVYVDELGFTASSTGSTGSTGTSGGTGSTGGTSSPSPTTAPDLSADFESSPLTGFGGVNASLLESAFGQTFDWSVGLQDLATVSDGTGGTVLRQRYVPNSQGTPVVSFPIPIPSADEMWLSYRIYFEPGWQWVQGGKLPGLAGGTYPTGGAYDSNGFSARFMWRANGKLVVYAYDQDRPTQWGRDLPLVNADGSTWTAPVGRWFTLRERIKMNSTGSTSDGEVEVWVDGERKLLQTGLRWRGNTTYAVDRLLYSSFYGGGDPSWSPSTTTFARFDDFKVSRSASGVD